MLLPKAVLAVKDNAAKEMVGCPAPVISRTKKLG